MNNLLIGTINKLIYWNGKQHTISEGNYYGITWNYENIYCSLNPKHNPISVIEVYNQNLRKIRQLSIEPLNQVHQILWAGEKLHITYTETNEIVVCDYNDIISHNWTNHYGEDKHHINSIWVHDDRIYAVESGLAGKTYPPTIQVLSMDYEPIYRIELPEAIHIHNIYIENGLLYTCSKFGLVQYNLAINDFRLIDLRRDKENGFFRGFARSKYNFYIGESQLLPRAERSFGDANIIVLNNNLEIVDNIVLKDTGQVQDIRIVNDIDYAHNGIIYDCQLN